MLKEFSLGPIWVWLILDESLKNETLIGGIIVISSLALFSLFQIKKVRTNSKFFLVNLKNTINLFNPA